MDSPPVPLPFVKSPPWHMKPGMILWKVEPIKLKVFPLRPAPFSPVHKHRKFSAVFGTTSPRNSITIRPASLPAMDMSKYTLGLDIAEFIDGSPKLLAGEAMLLVSLSHSR